MKKGLLFTLTILIVMVMLFAATTTPVAAKGGENSLTLIFAQYIPNKGVTFKFKVHGDFQNFTGFVVINGHEYGLNCKLNEDDYLSCTADQGLSNYVDDIATIYLNGHTFTAPIRGAVTQYCYPVWEWNETTGFQWYDFGPHCQPQPGQEGDLVEFWDGISNNEALFFESVPPCAPPAPGYYVPHCPEIPN